MNDEAGVLKTTEDGCSTAENVAIPPKSAVEFDEDCERAVLAHIEDRIGPIEGVLHALPESEGHIACRIAMPLDDESCKVIFTTGMSYTPMRVPEGTDLFCGIGPGAFDEIFEPVDTFEAEGFVTPERIDRVELMIIVPADWKLDIDSQTDSRWAWPISYLRMIASVPAAYDSWIGVGQVVTNEEGPFCEDTELDSLIVLPPYLRLDESDWVITTEQGKRIAFLMLFPIYADEREYRAKNGLRSLLGKLTEAGVADSVELDRESVVPGDAEPRKRFFGIF